MGKKRKKQTRNSAGLYQGREGIESVLDRLRVGIELPAATGEGSEGGHPADRERKKGRKKKNAYDLANVAAMQFKKRRARGKRRGDVSFSFSPLKKKKEKGQ